MDVIIAYVVGVLMGIGGTVAVGVVYFKMVAAEQAEAERIAAEETAKNAKGKW